MKYLTFEEYRENGGSVISETIFPRYELAARKRIDFLTDCRIQAMETVPEAVKLCMITIMEMDFATGAAAQATNPAVTSFNTDGYSESYGHALDADGTAKQMNKLIRDSLYGERDDNGIPLLYRGVRG